MDISELRRHNFKRFISEDCDGNAAEAARRIKRSSSQVNDLISGRKSFGEKFARDIEPLMGKPRDWLDQDHNSYDLPPADAQFLNEVRQDLAVYQVPEHIKQAIVTLITSSPKKTS